MSVSEEYGTEQILLALEVEGFLQRRGLRWAPSEDLRAILSELSIAFAAVAYYREHVHADASQVQVVLTRPRQSASLDRELSQVGWHAANSEETHSAFETIAQSAKSRFLVMTPFLDERGAEWLRILLEQVPTTTSIVLVLRSLESVSRRDYPRGFDSLRGILRARAAKVLNYSLTGSDLGTRETFHAKVLLADARLAYVGSANVTAASREYSMEMGVLVSGHAAAEIAAIVNAVVGASTQWQY